LGFPLLKDPAVAITSDMIRTCVTPLLDGCDRFALLDIPTYSNVGDSAIYLGALRLLDEAFARPADHVGSRFDPVASVGDAVAAEGGIILLQGGGNFGDVWPQHQSYREAVIARYPGHRIVQLPQSIHFSDEGGADRFARIVERHKDFHLLVRDRASLELAQRKFDCPVHLCPDMAYMLGHQWRDMPRIYDILCMFRTDKERRGDTDQTRLFEGFGRIDDWLQEPRMATFADRAANRLSRELRVARRGLSGYRERMFRRYAAERVERGLTQLASADLVVTDRLHVHILSTLLGKRHVVVDNFYGKISRYIAAFPRDGLTHACSDYAEARHIAGEIRDGRLPAVERRKVVASNVA
jgi:exopolysaccharide biosynthesis predicted pyruvyltransferase EpsI